MRLAPGTFTRDCSRILGVASMSSTPAYQADIDQIIARDGSRGRGGGSSESGRAQVEPAAWKAFLVEYLAADRVLLPHLISR